MADKNEQSRGLSVKVDVDVSEALTGLKAVQREAKKAAQALREYETAYEENGKRFYTKWNQSEDDDCTDIQSVCLSDVSTKYLHRELARREGVREYELPPHEHARIGWLTVGSAVDITGPARILVNVD